MRFKIFAALFIAGALGLSTIEAQAGTVRYAGKKIAQGSSAVAGVAVDGLQAAGDGMAAGGKAGGSACKAGVKRVGKGAKATPGLTARGVKGAGRGIARAIW